MSEVREARRPRVLYIVYWGALEPLGQSLVLPTVTRLARLGADLTLVTFEKTADTAQQGEMEVVRRRLQDASVRWIPLAYHKRPQITAKAWDLLAGVASGLGSRLRGQIDIVHARTFIGGVMGSIVAPLAGARLVFHNEGFYPDEQVDGGVWARESLLHRVARGIEGRLYDRADAVIALSYRAREAIAKGHPGRSTPTIVVPSAVDLDHFRSIPPPHPVRGRALRLVYVGAIGLRYEFHHAARFSAVAGRTGGGVHLRVLSRTDPAVVHDLVARAGLDGSSWSLASLPHAAMPDELSRHDAGLFFLVQGLSEHACSPTKIGEYWASGLPLVTTPNVSDTDDIIRRERVGVILADRTEQAYEDAAHQLLALLEDPMTPQRCRQAAERHYSLEAACRRQMELYRDLLTSTRG